MFWFTVTVEKKAAGSRSDPLVEVDYSGTRILVVDDNYDNRMLVCALLKTWGCVFEEVAH